jgi:hypothetical protein
MMSLLTRLADAQALVLGIIFAWAGIWKVVFPQARQLARKSALAKVLPTPDMAQAAHIAVGAIEIIVAALLLAPPQRWWAARIATALAVGFLAYIALAWKVAPETSCACMGGRPTPLSRRALARAGAILLLTILAWPANAYWGAALLGAPWLALVIVAELLALWALSPEFGSLGVTLQRRFVRAARLRLNPSCAGIALDWAHVENELRRTSQFNAFARYIVDPADQWREECAGFIAYNAVYRDQPATAIFTFPVLYDATEVSAALVDEASREVLARLPAARGNSLRGRVAAPA